MIEGYRPTFRNEVSFDSLWQEIKIGRVIKNCNSKIFDKLDNLSISGTTVFVGHKKYINKLKDPLISGVICTPDLTDSILENNKIGVWEYERPKELFYLVHELLIKSNFYVPLFDSVISDEAIIANSASISSSNVIIGPGTVIGENAVIHANSLLGSNCIIGTGSIIGADGFEVTRIDGQNRAIKHGGIIELEDNVEVQCLVSISKGLFPSQNTVVGKDSKIADRVHINHNVKIGTNGVICAGVVISGNVIMKDNVFIAPGAIISNRVTLDSNCFVSIGAVVSKNVGPGMKVTGNLAIEHKKYLQYLYKTGYF